MESTMIQVIEVDPSVTESDLYNHFSKAGEVVWGEVCKDDITCRSLGYGYVSFAQPDYAKRAIPMFDSTVLKGSTISVDISTFSFNRLIVKVELDEDDDGNEALLIQEDLMIPFANFGTVTHTKIYEKQSGENFFSVTFKDHQAAARAATALQNYQIPDMFLDFKESVDPYSPYVQTFSGKKSIPQVLCQESC